MKTATIRNLFAAVILAGFFTIITGAAFANDGFTPLHKATVAGDIAEVKRLIDDGADIDAKNEEGWTPLHYAAYQNQIETTLALIKAGANLFSRNNEGKMPLDLAIDLNGRNSEIVRILREAM